MPPSQDGFLKAVQDFQSARQRATVQEILARISGRSTQLLSYDEVAEKLKLQIRTERGLQQIPVGSIVGSVGRYTEFTRTFLPRSNADQERWSRVKAVMEDGAGLPPIEVYKVGEAYFVIDGNHRVSIARQEGMESIEARVIEVRTSIPLTPDVQPDDLIIKAEYAEFLEATHVEELRPNVDLSVTIPGQYEKLTEQILVQQHLLGLEQGGEVPFADAVADWYDNTYIPLAETIRDRGLLRWFPGRTLTDLCVWISTNRAELEAELGWEIQSDVAATDLILDHSIRSKPGSWRESRTVTRYTDRLFMDILVPLSGDSESWDALEQALVVAQQEGARVHGLHVIDSRENLLETQALAMRPRFDEACNAAGVDGNLVIENGEITRKICERAIATDLIVLKVLHPPVGGLSSWRSPFYGTLIESARPVLCVPARATRLQRALLAYDGSPRAREALFLATYLAELWGTDLIVFTATESGKAAAQVQDFVRRYLDIHEVEAEYVVSERRAQEQLNRTAEERRVDLVLMGSHSKPKLKQVLLGSALNHMLQEASVPIFICR
jgi:nucleotide-binding universal stress UspA family protein